VLLYERKNAVEPYRVTENGVYQLPADIDQGIESDATMRSQGSEAPEALVDVSTAVGVRRREFVQHRQQRRLSERLSEAGLLVLWERGTFRRVLREPCASRMCTTQG